jgi:hypothetical protein
VLGEAVGRRGAFLGGALHGRPPARGEHRRQREQGEQRQHRVHGHQQRDGDPEAQNPATGGEHRHVHVVEHEHLVAQHGDAVEQLGPLLMGDRRHRRLEPGHVPFQGDRHLVPEPPLHPGADRAQEPGRHGRAGEAERGDQQRCAVAMQHRGAEQREPDRDERVRQRGEQGQQERRQQQAGLVPVAQPAQPPHRRQRRGKVVELRHAG